MVNPAFSESQLKNLRRQNRHLASTHRRKLVFLQASRNPAHGSGRPFFVRDVPVPASFCSVPVASPFAPPAPVSAAPQLRPFCRPHRFCLRLPASPARRTELVFVLCTLPFRIPARHPGNGPARHLSARPLSLQPSPLRLPFPPLPSSDRSTVLAAPYLRLPAAPVHRTKYGSVLCTLPFRIPTRHAGNGPSGIFLSGLRPYGSRPLPLPSSGRSAVPSASALVFQPLPHAGQSSDSFCARCRSASPPGTPGTVPPGIFLPGPCRFSLRPSGSRFRRSPAPTVPPSSPLRTFVSQPLPYTGQSTGLYCARCRSASPPGTPGTVPPASFCPAFAPTAPGPCRSPAPAVPPSPPLLPSSSSLSRTPDRVRIRSVRAAVPHHRPALRERSRPGIFLSGPCRFALRPSGSRFRSSAVFALSRGDRQNRLLLRPGTRKGLSDRSQTAPFLSVLLFGNFSQYAIRELEKLVRRPPSFVQPFENFPPPSEHAAQRIEKLAGQLRPLPNRAAGRPPSRPGSGGAQQFIAPQQWIT